MALVPEQDELFPCPQSNDGAKVVIVNDRCADERGKMVTLTFAS
jgi:hypothetical protein